MVGRAEELGFLQYHLGEAISGKGGLVLISGEAGIGKTRLAKEFEARAEAKGCKVLVGNCVPSAQIPYLAFLEALKCLSKEENQSRTVRLKKAVKRASPDLVGAIPIVGGTARALAALLKEYQREDGIEGKENLLFGTLELFTVESEQNPLIIRLDDLQWADSASIGMLHFLARNVRDLPIFLLGTYRTEEVLSREKEVHPFLDSLQVMRREGIVEEVNLHPLAERETNQVVSGMLQRPVQKATMDRIFKESGGSPLFTVETLRMLVSEGRLIQKEETWVMTSDGEIHIPRTIQEVIARRMAKLSQEQRRILEWASVIGERFDPSLLSESMGVDELHTLDVLDTISQGFQLVAPDEGSYKFTHAKIRDVAYDSISKPKRMELHKRVGFSLEKRLPDNALLGPLSWHFDRAQTNDKCIKYSLLAGRYCTTRKAVIEAKSFYQLVLAKTEGNPSLVAERLEALEGLGDLNISQSSVREWYSYYEQFLELNRDQKARARVLAKAAECWDQGGISNIRKANEMLDEAESLSEGDPYILALIERERGELSDGDFKEIYAHYTKAKGYYEETGDTIGVIRCKYRIGRSLFYENHWTEAKSIAEELLPLAIKSEDPELISQIELWNIEINAWIGETEIAKEIASRVIQQADKLGMTAYCSGALFMRSWALELEGDFESARNDMLKVLEIERRYEYSPFITGFDEIILGLYELDLGLVKSAKSHYEEGVRYITSRPKRYSMYAGELLAGLLAAESNFQQSDQVFEETIISCDEMFFWLELIDCHSRYAMSLASRRLQERARDQFNEAMKVAMRIGCEKRVQILAKRVGIVPDQ
jgi:predicted ATPase